MLLVVNFKAYKEAVGPNAVKLAKICDKIAKKFDANIAVAVQSADILAVASNVSIPVLAQHVDSAEFGAHTGSVLPESIAASGAVGSLINHSEHQLPLPIIKKTIERLQKLNLISIACASNSSQEAKIAKFHPDILAIEPPALIGGKISVTNAKPNLIKESVKRAGSIPVLCGAGVHTQNDIVKSIQLGAQGVLVASGVVKAKSPENALVKLVKPSKK